jgi:hypothetical protein
MNSSIENTQFTSNTTLYAYWTPGVYTITLDSQGATSGGTTTLYEKYGVGFYTDSSCTNEFKYSSTGGSSITKPTKSGYKFMGYYTGTGGSGTSVIFSSGYLNYYLENTEFTSNVTVYAYWSNVFTITLNNQSATTSGTSTIYEKYNTGFYLNSSCSLEISTSTSSSTGYRINRPTRDGYKFMGYYTGTGGSGTQIINSYGCLSNSSLNTKFTSDVTIYAYWSNVFTITLNNQGATTAGTTTLYEKYGVGIYTNSGCTNQITEYVCGKGSGITIPKRTDYSFGGYYTETNGNGVRRITSGGYLNDFESTDYTSDETLYAYWIKNNYGTPSSPSIKGTIKTSTANISSNTWVKENLTITLSGGSISSGSGTSSLQYSWDKSTWYTYSSPISYTTQTSGTYIYARSVNSSDKSKVSSITSYLIKLDKTAPTVTVDILKANSAISDKILEIRNSGNTYYIHYDNTKVYNIPDPAPMFASDNFTTPSFITVNKSGGFKWSEGQFYTASYYVRDAAGNCSSTYTFNWYGNNSKTTDKWPF